MKRRYVEGGPDHGGLTIDFFEKLRERLKSWKGAVPGSSEYKEFVKWSHYSSQAGDPDVKRAIADYLSMCFPGAGEFLSEEVMPIKGLKHGLNAALIALSVGKLRIRTILKDDNIRVAIAATGHVHAITLDEANVVIVDSREGLDKNTLAQLEQLGPGVAIIEIMPAYRADSASLLNSKKDLRKNRAYIGLHIDEKNNGAGFLHAPALVVGPNRQKFYLMDSITNASYFLYNIMSIIDQELLAYSLRDKMKQLEEGRDTKKQRKEKGKEEFNSESGETSSTPLFLWDLFRAHQRTTQFVLLLIQFQMPRSGVRRMAYRN